MCGNEIPEVIPRSFTSILYTHAETLTPYESGRSLEFQRRMRAIVPLHTLVMEIKTYGGDAQEHQRTYKRTQ